MFTAEDILKEKDFDIISVEPENLVSDALKIMMDHNIGSILIKKDDDIIGIWTERDLMRNVLKPDFDINTALIGDYMTKGLLSAPHNSSIYQLLDIFLGRRLRHILIEKEGKYIGLLSTGDVIKASLNKKTKELEDLNAIFKWDYYENWKFKKGK